MLTYTGQKRPQSQDSSSRSINFFSPTFWQPIPHMAVRLHSNKELIQESISQYLVNEGHKRTEYFWPGSQEYKGPKWVFFLLMQINLKIRIYFPIRYVNLKLLICVSIRSSMYMGVWMWMLCECSLDTFVWLCQGKQNPVKR